LGAVGFGLRNTPRDKQPASQSKAEAATASPDAVTTSTRRGIHFDTEPRCPLRHWRSGPAQLVSRIHDREQSAYTTEPGPTCGHGATAVGCADCRPDSRKANPRLTGRRPGCWEPCPPVLHHMCPAQSARRLSNVSPIRTNDSVSRACPIGHALDISFENWTSSLRIYRML
jgi:hypothetical protein